MGAETKQYTTHLGRFLGAVLSLFANTLGHKSHEVAPPYPVPWRYEGGVRGGGGTEGAYGGGFTRAHVKAVCSL